MRSHEDVEDLFFNGDPDRDYHQNYYNPDYRESFYYTRAGLGALFIVLVTYEILLRLDYNLLPLTELLWNFFVYIVPAWALDAIEDRQNPFRSIDPALKDKSRTHTAKSEAMRRIFGLDSSGGVMASVASAGRRRLSILPGIKTIPPGGDGRPAGLGNWDNSCYQNSVLQGLASLDSLPDYLTNSSPEDPPTKEAKVPETKMAEALKGLIEVLKFPGNKRTVWTPATLKNMSSWQQQDAQEYYSKVLDEIDKEIGNVAKAVRKVHGFESEDSRPSSNGSEPFSAKVYRNPLEGLIAQKVGCMTCGYSEGLSMTAFNCLTVSLNKMWGQDISDCLDDYTKLEHIPGVECGKCTLLKNKRLLSMLLNRELDQNTARESKARLAAVEEALEDDDYDDKTLLQKCKIPSKSRVNSTKSKQAVIARPPRSLAIHLNRSVFDEMTGELQKNTSNVHFPKQLDLGPWCLGSGGAQISSATEEWQLDPDKPMVASSLRPSRLRGPMYELRAVITHYGRHENGHYVCYRKHPVVEFDVNPLNGDLDETKGEQEQWWRLSDDAVTKVSEENVLSQGGVFMLFYDCIEPSAPVMHPGDALSDHAAHVGPHVAVLDDMERSEYEAALPPDPASSLLPPSVEEATAAATIPLPELDDNDLSYDNTISREDSINTATSVSEFDDDDDLPASEAKENENPYMPAQPIMVSPYIPNFGSKTSEDGKSLAGSLSSLLMV